MQKQVIAVQRNAKKKSCSMLPVANKKRRTETLPNRDNLFVLQALICLAIWYSLHSHERASLDPTLQGELVGCGLGALRSE